MANAIIQIKVMPEGVETDLDSLLGKIREVIESEGGEIGQTKKEPIAFGLEALFVSFVLDEERSPDVISGKIEELGGVSSVEIVDFRRAIG